MGSIALIVGFGTRPAALALAFFTLVASFFFGETYVARQVGEDERSLRVRALAGAGDGGLVLLLHEDRGLTNKPNSFSVTPLS